MSELAPGWVLTEDESTPLHWVGTCRDVVMIFAYAGSQEDTRHVLLGGRAIERVREHHGSAKLLFVPPEHAKPPNAAVRDAIARLARRFSDVVDRAAVVVPGSGFGAAVHRGATTGVLALVRPRFEVKVYAELRAGLELLVESGNPVVMPLLRHCEARLSRPSRP